MSTFNLLLLPGDGIGVEVMAEVERLLAFFNKKSKAKFEVTTDLVGGAAIDKYGTPLTDETLAKAKQADAVLFGSVGGPKWDNVPYEIRPEAGPSSFAAGARPLR
jgi:Isocitrate/isopropylmalate dehydrogenase